ncbi:MAG: ABC transporter permease [Verrucomicrobia bacterium]|nr:ABC transporter permease [Verrucomicrobiota bacterium]
MTIRILFKNRPLAIVGGFVLVLFFLMALWAPFLACSKPICVVYKGQWYFPLFRYLLSSLFFTKKIDLFFNALGLFFLPFLVTFFIKGRWRLRSQCVIVLLFCSCFIYFGFFKVYDPAISVRLNQERQEEYLRQLADEPMRGKPRPRLQLPSWDFELAYLNDYAKLNLVLAQKSIEDQALRLHNADTRYSHQQEEFKNQVDRLTSELQGGKEQYQEHLKEETKLRRLVVRNPTVQPLLLKVEEDNEQYEERENQLDYLIDRQKWLDQEIKKISFIVMPLIRPYHWEEEVGGDQRLNSKLPFQELTRINRKDLVAALIFGSRISLLVGFGATLLACAIGIPMGLAAGFYGGKCDIAISRFVEVWEAMPTFFMLMLLVTLLQTKAIPIVIAVIALFGWTTCFRFVRAETFRQREMLYIDAARALGFSNLRILCVHVLPNSLIAVLALLPFDIMGAITKESGLAFLGLGEERSCSWGVLMDEGRQAFPAESMLLWPPAIVLTILLLAIAFVGEAVQSAANPKERL